MGNATWGRVQLIIVGIDRYETFSVPVPVPVPPKSVFGYCRYLLAPLTQTTDHVMAYHLPYNL